MYIRTKCGPVHYIENIQQYVKTVLYFFSAIDWYIANKQDVFTMYIRTKCGPLHYIENIQRYVKTVLYFFSAIDWYIGNKQDVFTMYIRTKCGPLHYIENIILQQYVKTVLHCSVFQTCLLYTSPSPRDQRGSRMPSSA